MPFVSKMKNINQQKQSVNEVTFDKHIQKLVDLGASKETAVVALEAANGDINSAIAFIFDK